MRRAAITHRWRRDGLFDGPATFIDATLNQRDSEAGHSRPSCQRTSDAEGGQEASFMSWLWQSCLGQYKAHRLSCCQSRADHGLVEPNFTRPFFERLRSAVVRQIHVGALVGSLLAASGPTAILWRVRAVVVYAFDRVMGGRSSAHVPDKRREAVPPFLTHHDATRAVPDVALDARVVTAIFGRTPDAVLRRTGQSVRDLAHGNEYITRKDTDYPPIDWSGEGTVA